MFQYLIFFLHYKEEIDLFLQPNNLPPISVHIYLQIKPSAVKKRLLIYTQALKHLTKYLYDHFPKSLSLE